MLNRECLQDTVLQENPFDVNDKTIFCEIHNDEKNYAYFDFCLDNNWYLLELNIRLK